MYKYYKYIGLDSLIYRKKTTKHGKLEFMTTKYKGRGWRTSDRTLTDTYQDKTDFIEISNEQAFAELI